jgi:hypothetical protein
MHLLSRFVKAVVDVYCIAHASAESGLLRNGMSDHRDLGMNVRRKNIYDRLKAVRRAL